MGKLTNLAGNVRVKTAEHNVAVAELRGLALADDEVGDGAHGRGLLPPHGIAVFLASRAGRGADSDELEVWVLRQKQDETLADGAGAAENALRWNLN